MWRQETGSPAEDESGEEREGEYKDGRRVGTRWEEDGLLAKITMPNGITQDRCGEGGGFGLWSLLQGTNRAEDHHSRTLLTW